MESFENSGSTINIAPFRVRNGDHFQIITKLVQNGRRFFANLQQGYDFLIVTNIILFVIQILGIACILVPIYNGIQLLWLLLVIIPMLTISLLWSPAEPNLMNQISGKNVSPMMSQLARLWVLLRCILPSINGLLMFAFSMTSFWPNVTWSNLFGGGISAKLYNTPQFQATLIYSQNISMIIIVLFYCIFAIESIHIRLSIFQHWKNIPLCIAIILAISFQFVFAIASVSISWRDLPIGYPYLPVIHHNTHSSGTLMSSSSFRSSVHSWSKKYSKLEEENALILHKNDSKSSLQQN